MLPVVRWVQREWAAYLFVSTRWGFCFSSRSKAIIFQVRWPGARWSMSFLVTGTGWAGADISGLSGGGEGNQNWYFASMVLVFSGAAGFVGAMSGFSGLLCPIHLFLQGGVGDLGPASCGLQPGFFVLPCPDVYGWLHRVVRPF